MNKVYILYRDYEYDGSIVESIHATEESAKRALLYIVSASDGGLWLSETEMSASGYNGLSFSIHAEELIS